MQAHPTYICLETRPECNHFRTARVYMVLKLVCSKASFLHLFCVLRILSCSVNSGQSAAIAPDILSAASFHVALTPNGAENEHIY